ncbi:hypothetical protein [Trichoplusia ni ascovirus 2c]|uniref:hypothetical protein n=1 Tax=Trichoplusia ni ascovirus 2c TaxID=328615 RepID=UPI0000E441FC|nr:hypothetical protein TNAV2c_gp036 [Trichoplusia ni ascovirus 2c]ABF70553.1 hypothetical protein [Trichoplusia ni ascovirus 2c]
MSVNTHNVISIPSNLHSLLDTWKPHPENSNYREEGAYHDVSPIFSRQYYTLSNEHESDVLRREFSPEIIAYMTTSHYQNSMRHLRNATRKISWLYVPKINTNGGQEEEDDIDFMIRVRIAARLKYGGSTMYKASAEIRHAFNYYYSRNGKRFKSLNGCVICMEACGDNDIEECVTFIPCGHTISCRSCITESVKLCPMCRDPIIVGVVVE